MTRRVKGLKRDVLLAELQAVQSSFTAGVPRYGMLDRDRLQAWARWATRFGIVKERPDVDAAFATRFADAE
jgi:hypothetical protein